MKILAVETATEACSAALSVEGEIIERYTVSPREHSLLILPMLESLLAEAGLVLNQLDALAFGRGPGSFTGVRIAAGVIQGVAFGADLPVAPVSTLAAMAQDIFAKSRETAVFTALDARMGEVYWGVYQKSEDGYATLWGEEAVINSSRGVVSGRDNWCWCRKRLAKRSGKFDGSFRQANHEHGFESSTQSWECCSTCGQRKFGKTMGAC